MNSKATFTRLIAAILLVVMMMSLVSCDQFASLIGDHTHTYVDGECDCGATDPDYTHEHYFVNGKCIYCGESNHEHSFANGKCECGEIDPDFTGSTEYSTITIAEALEIAAQNPGGTTELYYIYATVKSMTNASTGEMYIEDATGEIYVWGTRGEDGVTYPNNLPEFPVKGDKVLLLCQLGQHNGKNEVKLARLISFEHVEVDISDLTAYEEMTVAAARDAEEGKLVIVSGVVAQITYADGMIPDGVILVDGTSSIYVYSRDVAGQVSIGNTVKIAAEKTYYVLSSEQSSADKFGYKGCNQLDNAIVISNDKGTTDFDKSWITETTVKEIMDTPVTEDITTKIFKVNALVKKVPGNGFVNYYFDDIDGVTGSYAYTKCSGGDFTWLDEFDGKICTVYLVALNAKATSTGCLWRFIPVAVSDDGYTFDTTKAAEYAIEYHALPQFREEYTGDPALQLITVVNSELLGFEGVQISYSSSNKDVVDFTTDTPGEVIMHCKGAGTAIILITASYNGEPTEHKFVITVKANETVDYISVKDAINAADEDIVTVKGIVGPSVVNRDAFYLFGEDGSVITVMFKEVAIFSEVSIGHEIIVTGKREHFVNPEKYSGNYVGQATIVDAEVVANYYGNHEYSTAKFVTGKTVEDLRNLDIMVDYSTTVFVVEAVVELVETQFYTNIKLLSLDETVNITLYCSDAKQYSWLKSYAGQTVTLELAACNWNDKSYWTFCAIALVNEDGTKVLNTLNWN